MFFGILLAMFWAEAWSQVTIFPGGHFRKFEPVTVYEASFPLTYVLAHDIFRLPIISSFPLPLSPFNNRNLTRLSATAVEMDRHVSDLQHRMAAKMKILESRRKMRAIEAVGDFLHWSFGTATDTELHTLTSNEKTVNEHLNSLQDVVKGDHLDLIHSIDTMKGFSANVTNLLGKIQGVVREFQENWKNGDNVPQSIVYRDLMAYIVRVQTQLYHSLFLEATSDAQLKCRKNLLPALFVSEDVLGEDLRKLASNISDEGYEVSIPFKNLDLFYSLPIASCKISPKKIVVTVNVPVKKREENWILFEYVPSPLSWRNYTCTLAKDTVCVAVSETSIVSITGQQLEACQAKPSGMCLVPRQQSGSSMSSTCVEKMMGKAPVEELRSSCPFYCQPSHKGVLITQVAADSFIITNPTPTLTLDCTNSTTLIPNNVPGALELILPCFCSLTDRGDVLISKRFPCFPSVSLPMVNHILPVFWTSLSNISIHPLDSWTRPVFQNLSHVLDSSWTLTSPTFLLHNNFPDSVFEHVELPKAWWEIEDAASLRYYVIYAWLGILTLCLLYLIFNLCVIKAASPNSKGQP